MQYSNLRNMLIGLGIGLALMGCTATETPEATEQILRSVTENEVEQILKVETDTEESGDNLLIAAAEQVNIEREAGVPSLPFPDNSDPSLCGIPKPWVGDGAAYLTGMYEGQIIQSPVLLYDSHFRRKVVARAPHGAEVKILLSQSNPDLDYYLVKIVRADPPNEGWIPAPFLSFEPVAEGG